MQIIKNIRRILKHNILLKDLSFIIIVLASFFQSNSQAQILNNSELKLGGVLAFQTNKDAPLPGISLSISKDIIIWNAISIASEFSYIQKGYTIYPFTPDMNTSSHSYDNRLEYLRLSTFGKLKIGGEKVRSYSYLIGGINGDYFLGSTYGDTGFRKTVLGILGGIGGEIEIPTSFRIVIEFVINTDLTGVTKNREIHNTTLELKSGIKF